MDGAAIQLKANYGYAKSAQYVGLPYSHYRPASAGPVIASGNLLGTLKATFSQGGNYAKQSKTNSDEWTAYYDPTTVLPGDYLTNGTRTWFIAAQQPLLPPLAIFCERVMTLNRPFAETGVGALPYGGDTQTNETTLLTQWPASCLQGTKGEKGDVTNPTDVRNPWWNIRLPFYAGVILQTDDKLTDDLGRIYSISSAELSEYGWRLTVKQDQT